MTSSWWAKKLGNEPAPRQDSPPSKWAQTQPSVYMQPQPPQPSQPRVDGDNVYDSAMQWRGGEATIKETSNCPQCGSDLYFSRSNSGSIVTQAGAAKVPPRCYACGYTDGRPMQGIPT